MSCFASFLSSLKRFRISSYYDVQANFIQKLLSTKACRKFGMLFENMLSAYLHIEDSNSGFILSFSVMSAFKPSI